MSKSSVETTKRKKQAFLDNYPNFLRATKTAIAIGIDESCHYRWLEADEVYKQAFQSLKKEVDSDRLDRYEKELDKRALGGESKQSDILLMFGLKALDPSKYREKQTVPMIMGDITIKMAIPAYDEKLRLTEGNIIEGEAKEVT